MLSVQLFIWTLFILSTVTHGQGTAAAPATEYREVKIDINGITSIVNKNLLKKWLNIDLADRLCINKAACQSFREYIDGTTNNMVNLNSISESCPTVAKKFTQLYNQFIAQVSKQILTTKSKLSPNLNMALTSVQSAVESNRVNGLLSNDTGKLAVVTVVLDQLNNLTDDDINTLKETYPQTKYISIENLKQVINNCAKKYSGEPVDQASTKEQLQTLLNDINQGFSEA